VAVLLKEMDLRRKVKEDIYAWNADVRLSERKAEK